MNNTIETFTRQKIKNGIILLPDNWQLMFKRMYAPQPYYYNGKNAEDGINDIVDKMPVEKLDHVLSQIENSIAKIQDK